MTDRGVGTSDVAGRFSGELRRVARDSLRGQLKQIPKVVKRASDAGEESPGAVHKMRVASRRAGSALFAFSPLIRDERSLREIAKLLDGVRKSGSVARSRDVDLRLLGARLERCDDSDEAAAIGYAMRALGQERARGMARIVKLARKFDRDAYRAVVKRVIRSVDTDGVCESVTEWAMKRIGGALEEVWSLGCDEEASIEQLHDLRVVLKRLRYQAELFEPIVAWGGWRGMIDSAVECQERLGEANDAGELSVRVRRIAGAIGENSPGWSARIRGGLDRLAGRLEEEGREAGEAARAWWSDRGRRSVDRLIGNGSTHGGNGPMMDLDSAMDAALSDARRGLIDRGVTG